MGRSVAVHHRAEVTAYTEWKEGYTSMCWHCDEEVVRDGDSWVPEIGGGETPEHCAVLYAELVAEGRDVTTAMERALHSGHDYDSENWEQDFECTKEYIKELWPSLYEVDEWVGQEVHVFLRNLLVEVSVSEYCGLTSFSLSVADGAIDEGREGLAKQIIRVMTPKFKRVFGSVDKIGTFSNGEAVFERKDK
jgi:hypothetical protein